MDATLHALGGILLRAIPTFLLVVFLQVYLKMMFFKPLEKVLKQRYDATEGARKLAEQSLERASAKTAEYEAAVRAVPPAWASSARAFSGSSSSSSPSSMACWNALGRSWAEAEAYCPLARFPSSVPSRFSAVDMS